MTEPFRSRPKVVYCILSWHCHSFQNIHTSSAKRYLVDFILTLGNFFDGTPETSQIGNPSITKLRLCSICSHTLNLFEKINNDNRKINSDITRHVLPMMGNGLKPLVRIVGAAKFRGNFGCLDLLRGGYFRWVRLVSFGMEFRSV